MKKNFSKKNPFNTKTSKVNRRGSPSDKNPDRARPETRPLGNEARGEVLIPKSWRVVAGHHAIREAFANVKSGLEQIWLQQGWESSQDLVDLATLAQRARCKVEVKSKITLERLCHSHQGAALLVSTRPEFKFSDLVDKKTSTVLFLDGLEDPHNLGAIFRTSWLLGVHGLFCPADRAVGLTATVHKVASGGVEHVPMLQENQFGPSIERLKEQGYWTFGLSHKAEKSIFEMRLPEKVVWMIGAEDKGLRTSSERLCDELVSIPQSSAAASYNASVAAAIALAETYRQQAKFK